MFEGYKNMLLWVGAGYVAPFDRLGKIFDGVFACSQFLVAVNADIKGGFTDIDADSFHDFHNFILFKLLR